MPTTIDDAIEFFTAFIDAEHKVMEAYLARSTSFKSRNAKMRKMLQEPHFWEINPWEPDEKLSDMRKRALANTLNELAPRQLFAVEQHDVGKRKKLFAAYTSDHREPASATMYAHKFWADESLYIVGVHWSCADCHGLGTLKRAKCKDCEGRGWHRKTGDREIIKLGKPTTVKKLLRPGWPECGQHYDRL